MASDNSIRQGVTFDSTPTPAPTNSVPAGVTFDQTPTPSTQTPPAQAPNLNAGLDESQMHGAGGTWADTKKAPQPEHPAAKHGLLRRTWDFVNTPMADFVLPDGVKTEDLVKARAFETL